MHVGQAFKSALAVIIMGTICASVWADEIEKLGVKRLLPSNGHRLYAADFPLYHGVDSKVHVIDGDNLRLLANFSNGELGFFSFSADGKTIYVASKFYSRGDHGPYSEVLEFYDITTLNPTSELILPPKRAPTLGFPSMMVESAGASYLFVQNATPASSITVVDIPARKVLAELPTAGCFGIYASSKVAGRFSTLCGDGTAVTVSFDATGKETGRKRSAKLFDPENDALFISGLTDGDKTLFVSFLGNICPIDFSGEVARADKPWPIATGAAAAAGWRPGGYQLAAYNKLNDVLYVGMHPNGKEGSHKVSSTQIWKLDVTKHTLLARTPSAGATYMIVTQDQHPLLFAYEGDENPFIAKYDGDSLKKLGATPQHWQLSSNAVLLVH
jgi:methylamine dehydrogenase heavy chain